MTDMSAQPSPVFPAPTLVIGVGDLGLQVLERLGEDWRVLHQSGGDATLRNLRLLHLRSSDKDDENDWRRHERSAVNVARYVGWNDLPSLALNFVILRTLGLVRYRDGSYQVAVPRDAGVVEEELVVGNSAEQSEVVIRDRAAPSAPPAGDSVPAQEQEERLQFVRRRYFDWISLSPDPVLAVERLYRLSEDAHDLDLFVTPIVNRVRQGHSPRALLACIGRCAALAEGRDPSPWHWVQRWARGRQAAPRGPLSVRARGLDRTALLLLGRVDDAPEPEEQQARSETVKKLRQEEQKQRAALVGIYSRKEIALERHAPPPVAAERWQAWLDYVRAQPDGAEVSDETAPLLEVHVPAPMVPREHDVTCWLDPLDLLCSDWQATGWATSDARGSAAVHFGLTQELAPLTPRTPHERAARRRQGHFRLGLFDHECTPQVPRSADDSPRVPNLPQRLTVLSELTRRGLVRLWIDLQRDRVGRAGDAAGPLRPHDEDAVALDQSLEVLGELLVAPVAAQDSQEAAPADPSQPSQGGDKTTRAVPARPPQRPTAALEALTLGTRGSEHTTPARMERRLEELGLGCDGGPSPALPLLRSVELFEADVITQSGSAASELEPPPPGPSLARLRQTLNAQVRELYRASHLFEYRTQPVRRPPRLTVYVVGDMGEVFVRVVFRSLLREIHAELLRAFSPLFEHYREGFDRVLSVLPVLWMPHPADAFEGHPAGGPEDEQSRRLEEEAAIIDAIQGVRRWVEAIIPPGRRRVAQIYINSRISDTAVQSGVDAVRQTRDFVTLLSRSALHDDPWLRRLVTAPPGDDFFASFSCYAIEFPAEKGREYLANRLARMALERLRRGEQLDRERHVEPRFRVPDMAGLLHDAAAAIRARTRAAADDAAQRVAAQAAPGTGASRRELALRLGAPFEQAVVEDVTRVWHAQVQARGEMDDRVAALRRRCFELLDKHLSEATHEGDELIQQLAAQRGLTETLAEFERRRGASREALEREEDRRRGAEQLALRHRIPDLDGVRQACHDVSAAIERLPDRAPLYFGVLLWTVLSPALGGPLCHALAAALSPLAGPLGQALGVWGAWTGALLMGAAGWAGLRLHRARSWGRVVAAIERVAEEVRVRVAGHDGEVEHEGPSIRSFLETRLRLSAALATRGYCLRLHERAEADRSLAQRLGRSVDTQLQRLWSQAEDLGVHPRPGEAQEDVEALFATGAGERLDTLVSPQSLVDHYEHRFGSPLDMSRATLGLLERTGGLADWRRSACLADTDAILDYARQQFGTIVQAQLREMAHFADEAGPRLLDFVARVFPNIGFAAKFLGSEGLDPDGVCVLADAALVVHPSLEPLFQRARETPGAPRTTNTMSVAKCPGLRPNVAYMLSAAQGIRPHSVRNLRRFESFHDRLCVPEGYIFPLSGDGEHGRINRVTPHKDLAGQLSRRFAAHAHGLRPAGTSTTGDPPAGGGDKET